MDGVQEIDTVLQHVRQVVRQFRLSADTAIIQQILLFEQAFYGYRFTTTDFTAIWSAADQVLKVFDPKGRMLESLSLSETAADISLVSIPLTPKRTAA